MNYTKSWFSMLSLALLLSLSSAIDAFAEPTDNEPQSLQNQIHKQLESITLDEERTVLVDFIINEKGELMILKTNYELLDKTIKSKLNYLKIKNHKLAVNETYTLPVVFKAE